jgi:hypothetical protein
MHCRKSECDEGHTPPQPLKKCIRLLGRSSPIEQRRWCRAQCLMWGVRGAFPPASATWLGKSPTCRRYVGPTAKSRHIWPTGPRRADTKSFPTHFFVSGIADFLQIFSSTRGTYGVILNNPFSQVTILHPSHIILSTHKYSSLHPSSRSSISQHRISQHLPPQHKLQENIEPAHPCQSISR